MLFEQGYWLIDEVPVFFHKVDERALTIPGANDRAKEEFQEQFTLVAVAD